MASFGFDEIWSSDLDDVASELTPYNLGSLRTRNIRRELDSFTELCNQIDNKSLLCGPERWPKWMLVVVAKADLYWPDRNAVFDYYKPHSPTSPFAERIDDLQQKLGRNRMNYKVVPAAFTSREYRFAANAGTLRSPSFLIQDQCSTSVAELVNALEGMASD